MKKVYVWLMVSVFTVGILSSAQSAVLLPTSAVSSIEPTSEVIANAKKEVNSLTKSEKKARIKEAKSHLKELKAARKAGDKSRVEQIVLIILAIFIPPLAVYLHQGEVNSKFWISLVLTLLFWLPGMIYSLLVVTNSIK